jgi:hypothetical protein
VNEIADEAEKAIGGERGGDCLLLISSYKIGKEKVMLEVARRTGDSLFPGLPKQRPSFISTHMVPRNLKQFCKGLRINRILMHSTTNLNPKP